MRGLGLLAGAVLALVLAVLVGSVVASGTTARDGVVGPKYQLTGNGHALDPVGKLVTVGDFPDGSALSPDGKHLWVVDCGHGKDDARIVDVASAKVIQTLALPGCYGGVAFAPDGAHAYISGEPLAGNQTEGPTVGDQGDVIHVFSVNAATGTAAEQAPISLVTTSGGAARSNSFPPVSGVGTEYPEGLAVSPDGRWLVVALNGADKAVVIDLAGHGQTAVAVGEYPESVVFDPQGRAFVSNEYSGTVSVIDPAAHKLLATVKGLGGSRGDLASHPEGMVADPKRHAVYVAVTGRDLVGVVDTDTNRVTHLVSVGRSPALGTEPVAVAVSGDDSTLYSADAGEDSLAAISLSRRPAAAKGHKVYLRPYIASIRRYLKTHRRSLIAARGTRTACSGPSRAQLRAFVAAAEQAIRAGGRHERLKLDKAIHKLPLVRACKQTWEPGLAALSLIGRIPTAAYPDSVQTTPQGKLIWVAGKGFGSGPNPTYYFGGGPLAPGVTPPSAAQQYGTYVLDALIGRVGIAGLPTDMQVVADTAQADRQSQPDNAAKQPAGSPIPAQFGQPSAQIKHVFYIVRENRTYDQIFGSDPRGNGDKSLELFDDNGVSGPTGGITPNAHALARRFPLLDNFYEDSEVSVDGHLITTGAEANDYSQKATAANYSNRRGTYDFGVYPVTFPPNFFLWDQALKQHISFEDYGELVGALPLGQQANRSDLVQLLTHVNEAYPNNEFIGCLSAAVHATCTQDSGLYKGTGTLWAGQSRFTIWDPLFQAQVLTNSVPTLNYLILPDDHTNGTTKGDPTPQAMIADNDLGLGQIVDAISHSKIWSSSAIFVDEDDSQDGADHVDSHRSPAFVISPWTKSGVVSTRYDQYSVLKTIELITGLQPLELNDALATPMYDAFISGGQQPDDAPYDVVAPDYKLGTTNTGAAPDAKLSAELPWSKLDQVPQAISDQILWQSVHGAGSTPPGAGPNASPEEAQRAVVLRALLARRSSTPKRSSAVRAKQPPAGGSTGGSCPISWACRQAPPGA